MDLHSRADLLPAVPCDWSVQRRLRAMPPIVRAGISPAIGVAMARLSSPPIGVDPLQTAPHPSASPPDRDPSLTLSAPDGIEDEGFDVAQMRTPEGHAIYLKGSVSERVFRVSLARDPAESRLWCLFVEQRASVGSVGGNHGAVIGPGRLSQSDALACLRDLAADPSAWLSDLRRERLLAWIRSRPKVEKELPLLLRK